MGGVSIWHWVIVGVVVMLLFGRGKVSELMGDVAKGIKAFKKGMSEEEVTTTAGPTVSTPLHPTELPRSLDHQGTPGQAAPSSTLADRKLG